MATDTVTQSSGDATTQGSLAYVLAHAAVGDTIIFDPSLAGQTITVAQTLELSKNVTIEGHIDPSTGLPDITISGGDAVTVMQVDAGVTAAIDGLAIVHGNGVGGAGTIGATAGGAAAGGINNAGTLTVTHSVFDHDVATGGDGVTPGSGTGGTGGDAAGAILNSGTLVVSSTQFSNDTAAGGAGATGTNFNGADNAFGGGAGGSAAGAVLNEYGATLVVGTGDSTDASDAGIGGTGGHGGGGPSGAVGGAGGAADHAGSNGVASGGGSAYGRGGAVGEAGGMSGEATSGAGGGGGGHSYGAVATTSLVESSLTAGKLTVGAGSTLNLSGSALTTLGATVVLGSGSTFETTDSNGTTTTIEQSLTTIGSGGQLVINGGTFASASSGIEVQSGGTLQVRSGATLSSDNGLLIDGGGTFGGSGTVSASVTANHGSTISASPTAGTLLFSGSTNLLYGTLTGPGTIDLEGDLNAIEYGASVKSGGLTFGGQISGITGNLVYGGKLTIHSAAYFNLTGNKLNASKATTTLSHTTIATGTLFLGNGTVDGQVQVQSTLVQSGTLTLSAGAILDAVGNVSGNGTIVGGGSSLMVVGSAPAGNNTRGTSVSGATHFSLTAGDTLQLDNATLFRGIVSGFDTAANATIDVRSVATGAGERLSYVENSNHTGGTLKLANGANHTAFTLDGQFVAAGFHLASDSNGGTAITYGAPAQNAPNFTVAHA